MTKSLLRYLQDTIGFESCIISGNLVKLVSSYIIFDKEFIDFMLLNCRRVEIYCADGRIVLELTLKKSIG